ncbi:MAG: cupin domain-containing protein, partial [Acidimicrobiia bacterium]
GDTETPRPTRYQRSGAPSRVGSRCRCPLPSTLMTYGPGEAGEPGRVHKGAELVLVGDGVVQVLLNEETPVLRGGDALLVTQDAIHGWRNLLPETARLFWIVRD